MEPVSWEVKICPKPQGSSDLSPNPQVVQINDSVFWANQTEEPHRPAPQGGGEWFIERDVNGDPIKDPNGNTIPKNVAPGEPSGQVVFDKAGVVEYQCNVHPTDQQEKGSVIVPAQLIQIRRDDTGSIIQYDAASVASGSYVWWLNVDYQGESHQPSFAGINGPIVATDMSVPIQFNSAGTFPYTCVVHPNDPNDRGSITVT